jgi:enoyl-CoA hydratase/carnithine racemase
MHCTCTLLRSLSTLVFKLCAPKCEQVSAVIFTGSEGCFCTGAESLELRADPGLMQTAESSVLGAKLRRELARIAYTLKMYDTPLLPVVNGAVNGGGFGFLQVML